VVESNNHENTAKSPTKKAGGAVAPKKRVVEIPALLTVKHLSELLQVSPIDTIKQLMRKGYMASINQVIDFKSAASIAVDFSFEPRQQSRISRRNNRIIEMRKHQKLVQDEKGGDLKERPPVITIMGHVNHGKTRLLDVIRQTNIMDSEAGGITQHIGAYQVEINGQKMTFLDTPGHEAFTAMRARGAQVTDITILVVAADDGVMPQTLEAIDHAKAAGVPIMVAINKIDKADTNPDFVKQQLADAGLLVEEWGGDTVAVLISAKEKKGISELLENLMLVAELEELKADPAKAAEGVVIEGEMDRSRGPLATVLINSGTLRITDIVVVGGTWGKVKAMFNDQGKRIKKATPSTPVEILGLNDVPQVGDFLTVSGDERKAQALVEKHKLETQKEAEAMKTVNLTNVLDRISAGQVKELNIVLKADVQGSIEPIRISLEQLATEEVKVRVIRSGTGNVTESDIMLGVASHGVIIGFNVDSETGAKRLAEKEGISIRFYNVIYSLIDDVSKALQGLLEPTYVEVVIGRAEVRAVFTAGRKDKVAGVYVTEGKITRGASARIIRNGDTVHESAVSSLRRFKEDAREVATGYECGVGLKDFSDYKEGDILEFFQTEKAD